MDIKPNFGDFTADQYYYELLGVSYTAGSLGVMP
jgi:hypothetical protein